MPAYDDDGFVPAAPVATVSLRHPDDGIDLAGTADSHRDGLNAQRTGFDLLDRRQTPDLKLKRDLPVHPSGSLVFIQDGIRATEFVR
jgi:hypothetical protein